MHGIFYNVIDRTYAW